MRASFLFLGVVIALATAQLTPNATCTARNNTMNDFDATRLVGIWFEVASTTQAQRGACMCTTINQTDAGVESASNSQMLTSITACHDPTASSSPSSSDASHRNNQWELGFLIQISPGAAAFELFSTPAVLSANGDSLIPAADDSNPASSTPSPALSSSEEEETLNPNLFILAVSSSTSESASEWVLVGGPCQEITWLWARSRHMEQSQQDDIFSANGITEMQSFDLSSCPLELSFP